jgi:hypothetical protein
MDARTLAATVRSHGREALVRRFGIDPRALAAFRIATGLLLFADLLLRARYLRAFYTDAGVLPRSVLAELYPGFARLSLHALSGSAAVQALLFAVAGAAALALAVGYRTRTATVVSWLLLVSLHARNPVVLNGGDSMLQRLLFWSMFLPLGARWSVDAVRADHGDDDAAPAARATDAGSEGRATDAAPAAREDDTAPAAREDDVAGGRRVVGVATAALLVQVVTVYVVNAVFKLRGEAWPAGEAVRYVFSLEQFTVLLGDALAGSPELLTAITWTWLALLISSPLLLAFAGRLRTVHAALFAGMHLGMALTMRLGLFPIISAVAFLPFLPPSVWDAAERQTRALGRRFDAAPLARLDRALPGGGGRSRSPISRDVLPRAASRWARRLVTLLVVVALVGSLSYNAASLGYLDPPDPAASVVEEHGWTMFAPSPPRTDAWVVVPGRLASGEEVDAFHRSSVTWDPPDVAATYPTARWRKYLTNLRWRDDDALRRGFGSYLCGRWNDAHDDRLVAIEIYVVEQPTRFDGPEPTERVLLAARDCVTAGPTPGAGGR